MKSITLETKTLEEAYTQAEDTFRVNREYITFETKEIKGMFGLKKRYEVKAFIDVDLLQLGYETLQKLFDNMGISQVNIEQSSKEKNTFDYVIETDQNPVLIGKNGKTLESIQFYLRNLLNIFTDERVIVFVDIGGYKAHRKKQLEILATKTAKEVAKTKIEVKLDPMNAYERRIIHTKLADWRDVDTISAGEKQNRHIIIKPKRR